jgi:hypothetical protein
MGALLLGLLIIVGLGIGHLINWLLVKGIIWVSFELFNYGLYDKFWVIYVGLLLLWAICRMIFPTNIKNN